MPIVNELSMLSDPSIFECIEFGFIESEPLHSAAVVLISASSNRGVTIVESPYFIDKETFDCKFRVFVPNNYLIT